MRAFSMRNVNQIFLLIKLDERKIFTGSIANDDERSVRSS